MSNNQDPIHPYVGRGGLKLEHALLEFKLDINNMTCADFGCNIGGFTDCLLQHGAKHVVAIDTGYGILDYKLRIDKRVTVLERTNLLHEDPVKILSVKTPHIQKFDLIVIDAGWTIQAKIIPVALKWLGDNNPEGKIITLIKPHYELSAGNRNQLTGVLDDEQALITLNQTLDYLKNDLNLNILGSTKSPIRGGASRNKRKTGNIEFLVLLQIHI